jgi:6-phosphogluconolactonase/glucosamine-6-phosphate isomerase/deaminase
MVARKEKAGVVKTVLEDKQSRFPAQGIEPANGKLIFLIDREVASLLSGKHGSGES